jgi:hypothetical protein
MLLAFLPLENRQLINWMAIIGEAANQPMHPVFLQ